MDKRDKHVNKHISTQSKNHIHPYVHQVNKKIKKELTNKHTYISTKERASACSLEKLLRREVVSRWCKGSGNTTKRLQTRKRRKTLSGKASPGPTTYSTKYVCVHPPCSQI